MPAFGLHGRHPEPRPRRDDRARRRRVGGYGESLKDDYRRFYGATVGFAGRGEMIPNKDSYCEIDPTVVDKWGIPVLRFHFKFDDYEINQAKHMQETFRAIITEMGGTPMSPMPRASAATALAPGGRIIHELGVTRMGNDPKTSVLNKNCQAHDCRNVFVADGGPFVSQADKNCTWTILALVDAHERVHRRRTQGRKAATSIRSRAESSMRETHGQHQSDAQLLKMLSARPWPRLCVDRGRGAAGARARAGRPRQAAQKTGTPFKPKFFTAHEYADRARARRPDHPGGRAVGQRDRRRRARVHGLHR